VQFAQQENSQGFSIISVTIFQFNIAAEHKNILVTICFIFTSFHFPQLTLLPLPTVFSACLKRSMRRKEALLPTKIFLNQCSL